MKRPEVEAVLQLVNPLCEMAEEAQAHEVQMKGDQLHDTWQRLSRFLNERVELLQTYVRVHTMALQVSDAWDVLEAKVSDVNDDTIDIQDIQELWLNGNQKYVQLSHLARNFMADALKVYIQLYLLPNSKNVKKKTPKKMNLWILDF